MEDKFKAIEARLYKYKDIEKMNKLADIKIKRLRNDVSLGGGDMFGEKSSPTNKFNSSVENDVIYRELNDIDSQINILMKEKEDRNIEKELIEQAMELLEEEERKLIKLRYFSRPTNKWSKVAIEMNISEKTCGRMRRSIISRLIKYL